jgi:hypothetical protein
MSKRTCQKAIYNVLVGQYGADASTESFEVLYEACCNVACGQPAGHRIFAEQIDCFGTEIDRMWLCEILNEATDAGVREL